MTREEAIKIIKECKEKKFKYTLYTVNEYHAAIEMAINALGNENAVLDRVLEIIDRRIVIQEMKYTEANDILHETIAEIRCEEVKEIRNEILKLRRYTE